MQKLSAEEAKDLVLITGKRVSKISAQLLQLNVNEALLILRSDWKGKKPPYNIINRLAKKTGRKFIKGRLPDGSGWGVKRVA